MLIFLKLQNRAVPVMIKTVPHTVSECPAMLSSGVTPASDGEMSMSSNRRKEFFRGMKSIVPILVGLVPFSLVLGFAIKNAGFTGAQGTFFSVSMLGGTAQIAAAQLYAENSPAVIILATALVINLRYSMYSLSLYPILEDCSLPERLFAAFIVSDQSYAFTMAEVENNARNPFLPAFFFGASSMVFSVWLGGIFLGFNIGTVIPPELSLDFAIPLVFMSLLTPHLKGRDRQISAVAGGAASIFLVHALPLQSGLLAAILIGIAAGIVAGCLKTPDAEEAR